MPEERYALSDREYRRVWDRFYDEFQFRPSVNPARWPTFRAPDSSTTWSLASLPDTEPYERLDRFDALIKAGFRAALPTGTLLYGLDWQHESYRFPLDVLGGPGQSDWPLDPYPDGDYYALLTEDFSIGSLGHPWEHSICLFGADLLASVSAPLTELLGPPIRHGGKS